MKEFIKRTITALFLIPFAYAIVKFLPLLFFSLAVFIIISLAVFEFLKLAKPKTSSKLLTLIFGLLIGFSFTFEKPDLTMTIIIISISSGLFFLFAVNQKDKLNSFIRDIGINFLTVFYLYIPLYYLFELKKIGPNYLFFLIFVIAIGDSGAYLFGRAMGKIKIYPVASPNKSLEGIVAAFITASASGWLSQLLFPVEATLLCAVISGGIMGLLSQLSDPVESLFKRASGQKDSGTLLPGHGGVLDRIDSYIFCAPTLFYLIKYFWT